MADSWWLGCGQYALRRSLARLRTATGDPLLVRAGSALVPTPRALARRQQVHAAEPAHRWLRDTVDAVCGAALAAGTP